MSEWNTTGFESLLIESKDGEWGEGAAGIGLREAFIIRGTDFAELNNPGTELPRRWVKEHLVDRKQLHSGDLIMETAGGTSTQSTGRSVILTRSFVRNHSELPVLCASFSRHLRLDRTKYSPRFIYYLLQALYRSGYMAVFNIQHTGVSRFQYTAFKKHTELQLPGLPLQNKIAAMLSSYDELIDIHKHRIAHLETLAEETYREWFVRLRFPGHEKTRVIKGVPDGWEVRPLSEIVQFLSGYSFKSGTYAPDGEFGIVTIKNVQDGYFVPECSDFIDTPPSNMKEHCVLRTGDILMSLTGNVGRVCHVYGSNLLLNQRVAKLVSKLKDASQFIYHTFNNESMIRLVENLSLGSTAQMNLSPIQLGKQRLIVPDSGLLTRFETTVQPFTLQKLNLYFQCRHLERTRDLLLPRLITGNLSVENLDIQFSSGMAEELSEEPETTVHA